MLGNGIFNGKGDWKGFWEKWRRRMVKSGWRIMCG
jgi:hypothetical protein